MEKRVRLYKYIFLYKIFLERYIYIYISKVSNSCLWEDELGVWEMSGRRLFTINPF